MRRIGKMILMATGIGSAAMAAIHLMPFVPALGGIGRLLLHPVVIILLIATIVLLRLRSDRTGGEKSRSDPPSSP